MRLLETWHTSVGGLGNCLTVPNQITMTVLKTSNPPQPEIVTLGCRLNSHESEVMRAHATAAGLADTVIVNTCAVTAEAVRQATQVIRRLRRERPSAHIIVTGCAAQIDPARFAALTEVDHVIGNAEKLKAETFAALVDARGAATKPSVQVTDIMTVRETAPFLLDAFPGRVRAIVQVQTGCDHRCTFCIIPFGRGPSRSVPTGDVIDQVNQLVSHGYSEVVLTGVDITSYGADLPGSPTLGHLVRQVLRQVPELARLRLSSIDQVEADPDLLAALADEPRLMPHLHLSLQAGSDTILKRMKRRHLRADAIAFCEEARRLRPDIVFGADIIAGFPTETDAMFNQSLDLVAECGLTHLHVFPYSPRPGTPAARMPQLPGAVIKERAALLREAGQAALSGWLAGQVGNDVEVLVESSGCRGRTPHFAEVVFEANRYARGARVMARVTGVTAQRQLTGVAV